MATVSNKLISVRPREIMFKFELDKLIACHLHVSNITEHYVAFKVKTNSPAKYYVRPHTGVILPWETCFMRVVHQAQSEYPPNMLSKDKFQIQSAIVLPNTDVDGLPPDLFKKDAGYIIEAVKLKVVYMAENEAADEFNEVVQQLKEERDSAQREAELLQQELAFLLRRKNRHRVDPDFSVPFTIVVGVIGLVFGFLMRLLFSS